MGDNVCPTVALLDFVGSAASPPTQGIEDPGRLQYVERALAVFHHAAEVALDILDERSNLSACAGRALQNSVAELLEVSYHNLEIRQLGAGVAGFQCDGFGVQGVAVRIGALIGLPEAVDGAA